MSFVLNRSSLVPWSMPHHTRIWFWDTVFWDVLSLWLFESLLIASQCFLKAIVARTPVHKSVGHLGRFTLAASSSTCPAQERGGFRRQLLWEQIISLTPFRRFWLVRGILCLIWASPWTRSRCLGAHVVPYCGVCRSLWVGHRTHTRAWLPSNDVSWPCQAT